MEQFFRLYIVLDPKTTAAVKHDDRPSSPSGLPRLMLTKGIEVDETAAPAEKADVLSVIDIERLLEDARRPVKKIR